MSDGPQACRPAAGTTIGFRADFFRPYLEAYLVIVVVGRKCETVRVKFGLNGLGRVGVAVKGADRGRGTDWVKGQAWD